MILRMYELAAADVERLAGWPAEAGHYAGPIRAPWSPDRIAIELAVASADARGRALSDQEQRATVRRLIPWLARRLLVAEDPQGPALVVRVDGRLASGGVLDVLGHVDPIHTSLFHFTGASRLSPLEPLPSASLSMVTTPEVLTQVAQNQSLALHGGARLRAFAVPRELAPVVISCEGVEDERWQTVLPQVSLFISPSATLQSVFVVGPANAQELRQRLVNGAASAVHHPD